MLATFRMLAPPASRLWIKSGLHATDMRKTLTRFTVTDCAKTPGAMECRGDRDQQRATEMRIQNETMRAITTGRDRGAAVLFLHAGGGELGCAGARACSYMGGERNSGKPLPRIGASE